MIPTWACDVATVVYWAGVAVCLLALGLGTGGRCNDRRSGLASYAWAVAASFALPCVPAAAFLALGAIAG